MQATTASKAAYVKSQGQTRNHHCHWPGCGAQVPPAKWGCSAHWFKLPKDLRDRIWAAFEPGQERTMTPSREYVEAARAAQDWIAGQVAPAAAAPLDIYTDGSCYPNPGPGGWAFVVYDAAGQPMHEASGPGRRTTNNRMELLAIARALLWADGRPCNIHSDSQLCVRTLTEWAAGWQARGWVKREGVIANLDIVRPTYELFCKSDATMRWVRGHVGVPGNERADVLAGLARASLEAQAQ